MSIGRLIVEFEARTGKFETDTGRAAKIMEKRAKEIDAQARKIATAFGAAIGATAVGLGVMVKKSIDAADELSKLSQKIGISTEELSKLNYAADLAGVETASLQTALQKLNRAAVDTAQGTGAAEDAFTALGVSVKNTDGTLKSSQQLLFDVADAFAKYEDGAAKTAAAMDIFGKAGADLIPLLNGGSQAIREAGIELESFGGIVTTEAGKAAEEFNDNLRRLEFAAGGVANQLGQQLVPSLAKLTSYLVAVAKDSDAVSRAADGMAKVFGVVVVAGSAMANTVQATVKALIGLTIVVGKLGTYDFKGAFAAGSAALEDIKDDIKDVTQAYEAFFGSQSPAPAAPGAQGGGAVEKASKATLAYAAATEKSAKASKEAKKATDEWAVSLESARAIQEEADRLAAQANELIEERARIFEATRTPAEEYAATIERLNLLFNYGKTDIDTYTRAVEQAADKMDAALNKNVKQAEDSANEWADMMRGISEDAGAAIRRSLADFLFNPFEDGLKGMVRNFAQTLQRMAADLLASTLLKKLGSLLTSAGSSGGGGFWASVASAAGSFFGGGKASGGPVSAGVPYLVGERGPEMMIPATAGKIVPNHMMGGGSQNIRIVNAFDSSVIGDYLMTSEGEKVIDNYVSRNGAKIRNVLQGG